MKRSAWAQPDPSGALQLQAQPRGSIMRVYLQISGVLFGLIALAHLLRLFRHWPIDFAGYMVPLWASWLGLFLAGGLSIWALRLVRALPHAG
jgi:hypothetical protein